MVIMFVGTKKKKKQSVPEEMYEVFEETEIEQPKPGSDVPQTLGDFVAEMKNKRSDAKVFALRLKEMVRIVCLLAVAVRFDYSEH